MSGTALPSQATPAARAASAMSGAWASLVGLVLKLLAALGIYRAGGKAEQARQDRDTLKKLDRINDARSDNAARTDAELRERLLDAERRNR